MTYHKPVAIEIEIAVYLANIWPHLLDRLKSKVRNILGTGTRCINPNIHYGPSDAELSRKIGEKFANTNLPDIQWWESTHARRNKSYLLKLSITPYYKNEKLMQDLTHVLADSLEISHNMLMMCDVSSEVLIYEREIWLRSDFYGFS
ncbi:hypothetical protein [Chitinophaga filiformis]|uniref:Uncharacterized protein n=1 Tax=Chitinophaga filiformis TaxID=104663 RepID=A0A1G7MJH2_CHIFI|nr:hypothetical protein [Chitinophaga filiformis]SDF61871.1 hypothetical protein SAMN04488121_102459 [Chitinophaga filiformis]